MSDFRDYALADLLPQSPPFVLIDRIVACDEASIQTEVSIRKESLFFDRDSSGVATWVGIEYMAQSIAAFAGLRAKRSDEKVRAGFLLGTRKYITRQSLFMEHRTYRVAAREVLRDDNGLIRFQCQIVDEQGELTNEAGISIFQVDDLGAFTAGAAEVGR